MITKINRFKLDFAFIHLELNFVINVTLIVINRFQQARHIYTFITLDLTEVSVNLFLINRFENIESDFII